MLNINCNFLDQNCEKKVEIYNGWFQDSCADIDIKRSSRTPLRLSRVPAQGPSTWVNLRYLEYLRKGLNQRSSQAISSTCAASLNFYDLRLSRVPVQRVKSTIILGYREYLRAGLNQRSSQVISSTCLKSLKFADVILGN